MVNYDCGLCFKASFIKHLFPLFFIESEKELFPTNFKSASFPFDLDSTEKKLPRGKKGYNSFLILYMPFSSHSAKLLTSVKLSDCVSSVKNFNRFCFSSSFVLFYHILLTSPYYLEPIASVST